MDLNELHMATRLAMEMDALRQLLRWEPEDWELHAFVGSAETMEDKLGEQARTQRILRAAVGAHKKDTVQKIRRNLHKQLGEVGEQIAKLGVEVESSVEVEG